MKSVYPPNTTRLLFCPVCGQRVSVPPEIDVPIIIPDHPSGNGANMCAAYVITIEFSYAMRRTGPRRRITI